MNYSSHIINKIWACLGIGLILSPKINILNIPGQSTGVRVDDIVIFFMTYALTAWAIARTKLLIDLKILIFSFFIFTVGFLSFLFNITLPFSPNQPNILYHLRLIEYFVFFPIGYSLYRSGIKIANIAWLIVTINGIVMLFQYLGIAGGFASEIGFKTDVSDRLIGLTGGPWEISTLINIFFAIIASDQLKKQKTISLFATFLLTLLLIILTGSRISLIAHVALFSIFAFKIALRSTIVLLISGPLLVISVASIALTENPISERSQALFKVNNLEAAEFIYLRTSTQKLIQETYETDLDESEGDLSWIIRSQKWALAIKTFDYAPLANKILGIGPGSWGPALDGGWLRIATELGISGLALYFFLFLFISRISSETALVIFSTSISMIFIDARLSYKVMATLFLITGYQCCLIKSLKDSEQSKNELELQDLTPGNFQKTHKTTA